MVYTGAFAITSTAITFTKWALITHIYNFPVEKINPVQNCILIIIRSPR